MLFSRALEFLHNVFYYQMLAVSGLSPGVSARLQLTAFSLCFLLVLPMISTNKLLPKPPKGKIPAVFLHNLNAKLRPTLRFKKSIIRRIRRR
jgi:hypothetical protein